jgi:hypothetical protein
MGRDDYLSGVDSLPAGARMSLTGRHQTTPWDPDLRDTMIRVGVALHEEAIVETRLADLRR